MSTNSNTIDRIFFTTRGEFRILTLYIPAVLIYGFLSTFQTPIIEVYWDMIFYKTMAQGLHNFSRFDLRNHFPVPPLYPLVISVGFFASDYLTVETIQAWINVLLYFSALFPLYSLSRIYLSPRSSSIVCWLYLVYPSAIYSLWTMSENLAIPLTLLALSLTAQALISEPPSFALGIRLGIAMAALMLTRTQSLVVVAAIFLWLAGTLLYRRQQYKYYFVILLAAVFPWLLSLWILGYLDKPQIIYSQMNEQLSFSIGEHVIGLFHRFYAHVTALWLEGALLTPSAAILIALTVRNKPILTPQQKSVLYMLLFVSTSIVLSISAYRLMRSELELWSVSLRHISYANIALLPITVWGMGNREFRSLLFQRKNKIISVAVILLLAAGLCMPHVWKSFAHCQVYFTNSPSLDFFRQISNWHPWKGALFFALLSLMILALVLYRRILGLAIAAGISAYILGCSIDFMLEDHEYAVKVMSVRDLHVFCSQLQEGRWDDLPLYCYEDARVAYLRPNLLYWLGKRSTSLPKEARRPAPPYLYLTPHLQTSGTLVFQSGNLYAYVYK